MKQKVIATLKSVVSENRDLLSLMYDTLMMYSFICCGIQSIGKDPTLAIMYAMVGVGMYTFRK